MNKLEVQQRVLKNGKPLDLELFSWDEKTNTFASLENELVIDFNNIHSCTFTTGSFCTFTTGSSCTFTTGSFCTFTTGFSCTFTTGGKSSITFFNNDMFDVIKITEESSYKICPYNVKGYLKLIDGKWYLNGDKELGEYIIQDNILSRVISKKGNVYKILNHGQKKESFLITNGVDWSHGNTIKKARESLIYKIGDRDKSDYNGMTLKTEYTLEEAIKMYRVITGSCEQGVRMFLGTIKAKDKYNVKEIIELTKGQYGHEELKRFLGGLNE